MCDESSVLQDFASRGGGVEEFDTLTDSLRRKFGQDLGPYSTLQSVRLALGELHTSQSIYSQSESDSPPAFVARTRIAVASSFDAGS